MNQFDWLSDAQNQSVLYALSRRAVEEVAPEELPFLEERFPDYVELVGQHGVAVEGADDAFGFAGEEELLTVIIVPALAATLAALLIKKGTGRLADLRDVEQEGLQSRAAEKEQLAAELDEKVGRRVPGGVSRQQLLMLLATIVADYLAR